MTYLQKNHWYYRWHKRSAALRSGVPIILARDTKLTRKPDLLFVLLLAFGLGVLGTLLLPLTANHTVAAPASELQAGVIIQD